jgi:hypothetical protein
MSWRSTCISGGAWLENSTVQDNGADSVRYRCAQACQPALPLQAAGPRCQGCVHTCAQPSSPPAALTALAIRPASISAAAKASSTAHRTAARPPYEQASSAAQCT